uniref:maleylacetoacetate isomerase n=1 Tax=Caenorhabditis japonica TaxID=281687 RepID=A0A8R1DWJ4_CAEJA
MSTTKPILYSYWRSSCAWRVRIALALKGIEYEYRPIDLFSKTSKNNPEFVAHNPAKKVPTLLINGLSLTESLAIIEYLDEAYPNPPLLPKELDKRAYARAISLHIVSGIQPLQAISLHKMLNEKEPGYGDFWCKHFVTRGFEALEKLLIKHSGTFCVGEQLSIADLNLPSIIFNAKIYKVDMTPYPTINRIAATLAEIPQFQAAHPDVQPDAPKS